jgi:hypothetical protein
MTLPLSALDRSLIERLRAPHAGTPVTVIVGGCGSGRSERLRRVHDALGANACQYIDLERVATTPERCYDAIVSSSPFVPGPGTPAEPPATARAAYDALLAFLMNAQGPGGTPATFLLDEVLEVRTFESFPNLRTALPELARALAHGNSRIVAASRFATRVERWTQAAKERFDIIPTAPLDVRDVRDLLGHAAADADETAASVHALAAGHAGYTRAVVNQLTTGQPGGATDPISALAGALAPGGELAARCRFSYELRLHRARGYGALKAILDVLAETEPLTLTAIAQRIDRTPGSTKDYLSWLQDVDLIGCDRKRYRYNDPMLRLWVRLNGGPAGADEERFASEVQDYALERLASPAAPPAPAPAPVAAAEPARAMAAGRSVASGIIEID